MIVRACRTLLLCAAVLLGACTTQRDDPRSSKTFEAQTLTRWRQICSDCPPGRRVASQLARTPEGGLLLFGGRRALAEDSGTELDDTWAYADQSWTELYPDPHPSARHSHQMVYSPVEHRTVLFGGVLGNSGKDFMWSWENRQWHWLEPPIEPEPRSYFGMGFNPMDGTIVLFSGYSNGYRRDTWVFASKYWTLKTPVTSPPETLRHALAGGPSGVVLFGGHTPNEILGHTWVWDGTSWTEAKPASTPQARYAHAMAYDAVQGRTLMFGGTSAAALADFAEWDGTDWLSLPEGPPARYHHTMAYDDERGALVVYGGVGGNDEALGDTWEFRAIEVGRECMNGDQCDTDLCVDKVCCEKKCGSCQVCNSTSAPGQCVSVTNAQDDSCPDPFFCNADGLCLLPVGRDCALDSDCDSHHCQGRHCCSTLCDGDCSTGVCVRADAAPPISFDAARS